jgi:hypothetical protein
MSMNDSIKKGAVLLAILCLAVGSEAGAQDTGSNDDFNKGGRTGMQFLKIGVGARPAALGDVGITHIRDVNSVFWNPANVSGVRSMEATFSYTNWYAGMDYVAGAFGARLGRVGIVALSVASLNYGQLDEAVLGGGAGDARTGNTFSGSNMLVGLTFAREFTDRLSIGLSAKYVHESLFDYAAGTIAFDVGSSYDLGVRGVTLSMVAQNLSGAVSWMGEDSDRPDSGYDIPLVFRLGIAMTLAGPDEAFVTTGPSHRLVMAVEAINSNDYNERVNVGLEYSLIDMITLRGGYRFNMEDAGLSAGAGIMTGLGGIDLRVDYAYVAHRYLNAPHRLSLSMAF